MEYAILSKNIVVNVIVADADFVARYHPGAIRIDSLTPRPGIGWTWNGAAFLGPLLVLVPEIDGADGIALTPVSAHALAGSGSGYAFSATGLPSGLSMSVDGLISGTPHQSGNSTYSVTVTDSDGNTATSTGFCRIT